MINSIKKISGMGVFGNYVANSNIPKFRKYNVVYGQNGTGKTTLSRLFSALELGATSEHPDLKFSIETDLGEFKEGQFFPTPIRVFNSDYVDANLGQFEGALRNILIVGEENKIAANELILEREVYEARLSQIAKARVDIEAIETERGGLFSQIAKTISEATSGTTSRTYRKQNAEAAYSSMTGTHLLSAHELALFRTTVRQNVLDRIVVEPIAHFSVEDGKPPISVDKAIMEIKNRAEFLITQSAQAGTVARLAEFQDIADWVEKGLEVHRRHESTHCEFCAQALPQLRLDDLLQHFTAADQALKSEIIALQNTINIIQSRIVVLPRVSKPELYSELQEPFVKCIYDLEYTTSFLQTALEEFDRSLTKKLSLRTTGYAEVFDVDVSKYVDAFNSFMAIVEQHNIKTRDFDEAKRSAITAVEQHYLSSIATKVEACTDKIKNLNLLIDALSTGSGQTDSRNLAEISKSIEEKQAAISSAHAGGSELTGYLRQFLGRSDLSFDSGDEGYFVNRRGKPAKRLSEGEKTAIAFVYFIVQLREEGFNSRESIVVIDDPISSLDASSIYQAFSFLKNGIKDVKQVYIFTHNFDFLKLLINWMQNIKPKTQCGYFMINCSENDLSRDARLEKLDSLLEDHPTEYHYMFKVLHDFKSDGTIQSCYHIPNIARKVLETFLEFHVPSNDSLYKKLEETHFDEMKKTAIYKFANDLSHRTGKGFDPALVAETQKNTRYLLEMIETVAPIHFNGLKRLSS